MTVLDADDWYTHVSLIGQVGEMIDDKDLRDIDRLSEHYTGKPYPDRQSPRVSAWIVVEHWFGWGKMKT